MSAFLPKDDDDDEDTASEPVTDDDDDSLTLTCPSARVRSVSQEVRVPGARLSLGAAWSHLRRHAHAA